MPSHHHNLYNDFLQHSNWGGYWNLGFDGYNNNDNIDLSGSTENNGSGHGHNHGLAGGVSDGNNTPLFYALAYIMKL